MKIRIGISLADSAFDKQSPEALLNFIDDCERWDIDSIWVSDRIAAPNPTLDPVVFMAYLASRMRNMKFGTSALVLPTRQPRRKAPQTPSRSGYSGLRIRARRSRKCSPWK